MNRGIYISNLIEIAVGIALMIFIPIDNYLSPTFSNTIISAFLYLFPFFIAIPVVTLIRETYKMKSLSEKEIVKRRVRLLEKISFWYIAPLMGPTIVFFALLLLVMPPALPITFIVGTILFSVFVYKVNMNAKNKLLSASLPKRP